MHRHLLVMAAVIAACHGPSPATPARDATVARGTLVIRERARHDDAQLARGLARLCVRVRSVEDTAVVVEGAQLRFFPAGADTTAFTPHAWLTDSLGLASFDSLPAGQYTMHVRRIGYEAHTVAFALPERCAVSVEADIGPARTCLFECPSPPARVVVTTCAPRDAQ